MTVAVVIPTWNAAAFIERTLASVIGQTELPDELIIADDASSDDTVKIIRETLSKSSLNWRLLESTRNSGGPGGPMNRAIEASTADWILTLDHDDELLPDRVKQLKANIHRFTDCGVVIGQLIVREASRDRGHLLDTAWNRVQSLKPDPVIAAKDAYAALARWGCYAMSCSAMVFPKAVWRAVNGFDASVRTCIDFAFLEAVLKSHPLGVLDAPVAYWTWSPRNLSHDVHARVFEVSTVMERMDLPEESAILRKEMLNRIYYLTARGDYRAAWRLWKRTASRHGLRFSSLITMLKCFAKAGQRQFRQSDR